MKGKVRNRRRRSAPEFTAYRIPEPENDAEVRQNILSQLARASYAAHVKAGPPANLRTGEQDEQDRKDEQPGK